MTFEYIVENPGEVADMIKAIAGRQEYNSAFFYGISNQYEEIVDENREKYED